MKVLVVTTVFPNKKQHSLGVFVRERISRLANFCELKVLAPINYFPFAGFFHQKYNLHIPTIEYQNGIEVYHPKFFLFPGIMKILDGFFLYASLVGTIRKIRKTFDFDIIDSHFAYPDGFAAVLLSKHFNRPVSITLRGTINRLANYRLRRMAIKFALKNADKVFSVSFHLARLAQSLGVEESKFKVIPNGVDISHFSPLNKAEVRRKLKIFNTSKVIVSVGGLVERKGHHRVIQVLPDLIKKFPDLIHLVVGSASVEGDMSLSLRKQVQDLGLAEHVRFIGSVPHSSISEYLSAADIFVLPTRFEGCPNVFLEANACGLPVVSTQICGNEEFVKSGKTGFLVPFGNQSALMNGIEKALIEEWDKKEIVQYARVRSWEKVAEEVFSELQRIVRQYRPKVNF